MVIDHRSLLVFASLTASFGAGCILIVGTDDRSVADAGKSDGGVDLGDAACRLGEPFSALKPEKELSRSTSDESVRLTPNGLEAYVGRRSVDINHIDLFRYERATRDAPWVLIGEVPLLDKFPDGGRTSAANMTFTANGLEAIFQYYEDDTGHGSLFGTKRSSPSEPWSAPAPVIGLDSPASDEGPVLSADGQTIYFFSDRETRNPRLYTASANGIGFTKPVRMPNINPDNDSYPVVTGDELTLYFSSSKSKDNVLERKLYKTTRARRDLPFASPGVEVTELNADGWLTVPSWVSPDGCEIYVLASRPDSNQTGLDVYSARKPPR